MNNDYLKSNDYLRNSNYLSAMRRFREERIRQDLTQPQLCRQERMTQSVFSKAESGLRRFSFPKTGKLCSSINIFYVFTGKKADASWVSQKLALSTTEELLCHLYMVQIITSSLRDINRSKSFSGVSADSSYGRIQEQLEYLHYFPGGSASNQNIFYNVRNYFGHTQKKMADLLGMDIKKLRDLEKGRRLPDSEVIWEMYACFHVSPAFIPKDANALRDELDYVLGLLDRNDREIILQILETWTKLL